MAKTPEGGVKDAVKRAIKDFETHRGVSVYTFWPVQMGFGAATLDMIGSVNGHAFAIETKATEKKSPTPRQAACIEAMERAGMSVLVIGSEEAAAGVTLWLETRL